MKKKEAKIKENNMTEATQTKEDVTLEKAKAKEEAKAAKLAEKARIKEEKKAAKEAEKVNKPRKERKPSMASVWGAVFAQAATEGHDQAWVEAEMLARYPGKQETIAKWTLWYKNFYNMGRIKGYETPLKVEWPRGVSQEVLAKREAKLKAKEEAKQAKLAAREQAKAEKAAKKDQSQTQKQPA